MNFDNLPDDFFVTSHQFTRTAYRDVYPSIDPTSPELSQAGKVVIITGASKGIGRHVSRKNCSHGSQSPSIRSLRFPKCFFPPSRLTTFQGICH
jgi:hypothetical protein